MTQFTGKKVTKHNNIKYWCQFAFYCVKTLITYKWGFKIKGFDLDGSKKSHNHLIKYKISTTIYGSS